MPPKIEHRRHLDDEARKEAILCSEARDSSCLLWFEDGKTRVESETVTGAIPVSPKDALEESQASSVTGDVLNLRVDVFHLNPKAFYTSFVQGALFLFFRFGSKVVIHSCPGDDVELLDGHIAQILSPDAAPTPIPVQLRRDPRFYHEDNREALVDALSPAGQHGEPFALSRLVSIRADGSVNWWRGTDAWTIENGAAMRTRLDRRVPELLSRLSLATVSAFEDPIVSRTVRKLAADDAPFGTKGNWMCALLPMGLILVSRDARSMAYHQGIDRAVRLVIPEDISHHAMINTISQMEAAANAMLLHCVKYLPEQNVTNFRDIRVTL